MPRLLFYTPSLAGGGAERVWALLASSFATRGYDVLFVVDFDHADNQGFLSPAVRRTVLSGNHFTAALELAQVIRRENPDVLLSAISVANVKLMTAAALAGRLGSVVLSYHGYANSEPKLLSSLGYVMTPLSTRVARRTVAVSHGLRRYLIERCRASAKHVEMVPNPIPVELIRHANAAELRTRRPLVLGIGRLVGYKGFDLLLDAFARVRTPDAELVILGEGDERPALERRIAALGLVGRVRMPGYVPEPWRWLEEARCFVSASRTEAFGNVVVEALAAGLPVVSTACHGPVEILVNGRYGRLVPVDDVAAMAEGIDAALADTSDTFERRRRAEAYRVDTAVDEYERLVAHVMMENGRA
jgi:glycosyltransferase involved in cell wall biosynthesis